MALSALPATITQHQSLDYPAIVRNVGYFPDGAQMVDFNRQAWDTGDRGNPDCDDDLETGDSGELSQEQCQAYAVRIGAAFVVRNDASTMGHCSKTVGSGTTFGWTLSGVHFVPLL